MQRSEIRHSGARFLAIIAPHRERLVGWLWPLLVTMVSLTIIAAAPLRFRQLRTISESPNATAGQLNAAGVDALAELGLTPAIYAGAITALETFAATSMLFIGAIIFWRRKHNPAVFSFSVTLVTFGIIASPLVIELQQSHEYWDGIITFTRFAGLASLVIAFLRFPDGRFVPDWSRWLAVVWVFYLLTSLIVPSLRFTSSLIIMSSRQAVLLTWALFWLLLLVLFQVYRYRYRATPEQRQQTKWVVYGLVVSFFFTTIASLPLVVAPSLRQSSTATMAARLIGVGVVLCGQIFLSFTIAVAVLRYRLYDIDLLINRTLVYTLLTSALILIYSVTIVVLQSLLPVQSQIATVLSTLAVATAFSPLRRRIQTLIDRRFYRQKYDAARTLARFAIAARDEVDLDALSSKLTGAIVDTLQPAHFSLWLLPTSETRRTDTAAQS
jgi:hypothetical protein